jgi:hypothetical protein
MLFAIVGILVLVATGKWAFDEGAKPIRRLKPGEYCVDAILHVNNDHVLLAVSWPVDYGYYEYRLARLPNPYFCPRVPVVGDEIRVSREVPNSYQVHRPGERPLSAPYME